MYIEGQRLADMKPKLTDEERFRQKASREGVVKFCVGVVIERGDRVLLVRRVPEDFLGGYWELPGGGVDEGEDFPTTIIRETSEELGLKITGFGKTLVSFDYVSETGNKTRQYNIVVQTQNQKVVLNPKEHDAFEWVGPEDFAKLTLTEQIQGVLKSYYKVV